MDPLGLPTTTTTTIIHEGNSDFFAQKNTFQQLSSNLSLAAHDNAKHWYFLFKSPYDEFKLHNLE